MSQQQPTTTPAAATRPAAVKVPRSAGLLVGGLVALLAGSVISLLSAIASIGGPSYSGPSSALILGILLLVAGLGLSAAGLFLLLHNVDGALAKYLRTR